MKGYWPSRAGFRVSGSVRMRRDRDGMASFLYMEKGMLSLVQWKSPRRSEG